MKPEIRTRAPMRRRTRSARSHSGSGSQFGKISWLHGLRSIGARVMCMARFSYRHYFCFVSSNPTLFSRLPATSKRCRQQSTGVEIFIYFPLGLRHYLPRLSAPGGAQALVKVGSSPIHRRPNHGPKFVEVLSAISPSRPIGSRTLSK